MTDSYDTLLAEDNLVVLQQVIATETAVLPFNELEVLNPSMSDTQLRETLNALESEGYIEIMGVETPEPVPEVFYAATEKSRSDLQDLGLWNGIGILYQAYSHTEVPEWVEEQREYYPVGLLEE